MSSDRDEVAPAGKVNRALFGGLMAKAQEGDTAAIGDLIQQCRNDLLLIANQEIGTDVPGKTILATFTG